MYLFENFSVPTNATSGRPAYSLVQCQIKSAIARLLVSCPCQVKIREVKPKRQHRPIWLPTVKMVDGWWHRRQSWGLGGRNPQMLRWGSRVAVVETPLNIIIS